MTVNALIAKAMSTNSEEEALSAFRMARKKNNGKTFIFEKQEQEDEWKHKAKKYYDAARLQKEQAEYFEKEAINYYAKMTHYKSYYNNRVIELERLVRFWKKAFFTSTIVLTVLSVLILGFML